MKHNGLSCGGKEVRRDRANDGRGGGGAGAGGGTSRRRLMGAALGGGAAWLAGLSDGPRAGRGAAPGGGEFTRFVHLTDVHLCGRAAALDGFAAALDSIARLDPRPQFILSGGDHVMDAFGADRASALAQWDLYASALSRHCRLPVFPVLGNHDIWGWGSRSASCLERGYGKAMAIDRLGMRGPYYSFERAGWHFVCLDNVAPRGDSYTAAIDAAQLEWLRSDLAAAGRRTPVCVVSHIPLVSACVFFDGATSHGGGSEGYHVHPACMQNDVGALLALLRPYNVRLALSGHIHLIDRVDYGGISFLCNGSICGNWWDEHRDGFDEGYSVIDVWGDGTFEHEYVRYLRGA